MSVSSTHRARPGARIVCAVLLALVALTLTACGDSSGETSGADFSTPKHISPSAFHADAAQSSNGASIDTSCVNAGYVGAAAASQQRLKFLVTSGQATYSYDLPQDGAAIICPLTFGDGAYQFRVMQNTSGDNYVELLSATASVALSDERAPFTVPNVYCNYTDTSACVKKARELTKGAQNQGDAVKDICQWVVDNVSYDNDKASKLKQATGYVPNPDKTLTSKKGVCFDYASLGAAMLRSVGIPTKIVTGYVSPDQIYHAWIMVYIDGTWKSAQFSVDRNTWSRVDLTFAASGDNKNVGDGKEYTDRYVY